MVLSVVRTSGPERGFPAGGDRGVEDAVRDDPVVAAVVGGMNVQHAIVAGAGARPVDSNGNPWSGSYITASGNLLADFTANANGEMQGRLQAARLYHMTDDAGRAGPARLPHRARHDAPEPVDRGRGRAACRGRRGSARAEQLPAGEGEPGRALRVHQLLRRRGGFRGPRTGCCSSRAIGWMRSAVTCARSRRSIPTIP